MAQVWRCTNGHQWTQAAPAEAWSGAHRCPVCNAAAVPLDALAGETLAHDPQPVSAHDETRAPDHGSVVAPPPKPPANLPQVAGYEVLGVLGRGGMGVVYRARQKGLNRLVALKMVLAGGQAHPDDLQRFRVEAEAAARLQHPGIAQVYEIGDHLGAPFFSLEYVDGGSLSGRLDGTPLPPPLAAELVAELAAAMHYAHERGIVHRDLKPANILVAGTLDIAAKASPATTRSGGVRAGRLKITDFGLAKRLEDDSHMTGTGAILGTPSYMAPEQAEGRADIGPRTDVHALGAILYEFLTGHPPFRGASAIDTVLQVQMLDPVPPRRSQPRVPADLENICLKCLQKPPARRYNSAGELAEDLQRFLEGRAVLARPTSPAERVVKWARRYPAAAALVAVVAVVVLAVGFGGVAYAERERRHAQAEERQRIAAQTARAEAERQAKLAEERKADALREFGRAEGNFQHAWSAVNELLGRVAEAKLQREPRAIELRRNLVEAALRFLQRFLDQKGADRGIRLEVARAYVAAGRCRAMLEQQPEAVVAYGEAARRFRELADESESPALRRDEAAALRTLAVAQLRVGKRAEAAQSFDRAGTLLTALVAAAPADPGPRYDHAALLLDRGIEQAAADPAAAEASFRAALEQFTRLVTDRPGEALYALERAKVQSNLGALLVSRGRYAPALADLRAAVGQLRELVGRHPDDVRAVVELGRAAANLGGLLAATGDAAGAEAVFRQAVATLDPLADQFPRIPDYRYYAAQSHAGLGQALAARRQADAALAERGDARGKLVALAREFPTTVEYRAAASAVAEDEGMDREELNDRAGALQALAEALAQAKAAVALDPGNPDYQQALALRHLNLGIVQARDGRGGEAETNYDRATALLDGLDAAGPPTRARDAALAGAHANRALLMRALGQPKQEERAWRRVADVQARIAAAAPTSGDPLAARAETLYTLAGLASAPADREARLLECVAEADAALAKRGRAADVRGKAGLALADALLDRDAAAAADAVLATERAVPAGWASVPRLAGALVRCAARARADGDAAAAGRHEAAALAVLGRWLTTGRRNLDDLRTADDLAPLRGPAHRAAWDALMTAPPNGTAP